MCVCVSVLILLVFFARASSPRQGQQPVCMCITMRHHNKDSPVFGATMAVRALSFFREGSEEMREARLREAAGEGAPYVCAPAEHRSESSSHTSADAVTAHAPGLSLTHTQACRALCPGRPAHRRPQFQFSFPSYLGKDVTKCAAPVDGKFKGAGRMGRRGGRGGGCHGRYARGSKALSARGPALAAWKRNAHPGAPMLRRTN